MTDQLSFIDHIDEPEEAFISISDKEPISKTGDVWLLGDHRVMCGDSTNKENMKSLMGEVKADIVFTDPPYGYSYQSNFQDKYEMITNDDKFLDFIPNVINVIEDNSPIYVCAGWQTSSYWFEYFKKNNLKIKNIIIWKKNNWSMGDLKGAYAGQYEMIFFLHKGQVELNNGRDRDVWEIDREPPKDHPTTKPVALIIRALKNHNSKLVLDSFLGSGSTLIACEQTNRICYGMEIDPLYVDVICRRWQNYTKKYPVLESTGELYDFVLMKKIKDVA